MVIQWPGGISVGSCDHLGVSVPDCSKSEALGRVFQLFALFCFPWAAVFEVLSCAPYVAMLEIVQFSLIYFEKVDDVSN